MNSFELELRDYIFDYCIEKDIHIDIRFACFGDKNKFYTYDTEFSLDCVSYYADDFEDIKQFFITYLDAMLDKSEVPMNRIALYIKDIVDMDDWYEIIVGGGMFVDESLT